VPWFLVDDHFHSHPHAARALATEPAALSLWLLAGSWSSAHLTDGVVPDDVLPQLAPDPVKLAEALVTARLWKRVRGGYKFVPGATHRIPSKQAVENERKLSAARKRKQRSRHADVTPMSRPGTAVDNGTFAGGEERKPRSDPVRSRRDMAVTPTVTHGVTLDRSDPDPPGGSVVNPPQDRNGRAPPELIDMIMNEILAATGRHITPEWAQRTHDHILAGRAVASPAGYIRQAIRSEPDPKTRFLPLY
jgi:hypothetical protein